MKFYIETLVDSDFDAEEGISSIVFPNAIIDKSIFNGKDFFKPVLKILECDINELSRSSISNLLNNLPNVIIQEEGDSFLFSENNPYDIDDVIIDFKDEDQKRISIRYKHCSVSSFYIIQESIDSVKVILTELNRCYYTLSNIEWFRFLDSLKVNYDVREQRNFKIDSIFSNKSSLETMNLVRILRFIEDNEPKYRNSFLSSVLSFYGNRGYLSDKQINKCLQLI